MSTLSRALVIGSSGGIGESLVQQLAMSDRYSQVFAVSRSLPRAPVDGVNYQIVDSMKENDIADYCRKLSNSGEQFSLIVCCIGSLSEKHDSGLSISPEKRIEDLNQAQLQYYFQINTVMPALWLNPYKFNIFKCQSWQY